MSPPAKRAWRCRLRQLVVGPAGVLLAAYALGFPGPPASPAGAAERLRSQVQVSVERGLLAVDVRDAPLADVLRVISERTAVRVTIGEGLRGVVTAAFTKVPLDEGIMRLARGNSLVLIYASLPGSERAPQLAEVWVYRAPRAEPPLDALDRSARPETVPELASARDETSLPRLAQILARDPEPRVRADAVAALATVGGPHAAGVLTSALKDQDPSVRLGAVEALSEVGGEQARKAMTGALRMDPDPRVRLEAARALALFAHDAEVRMALVATTSDSDSSVREAASLILLRWDRRPGG